MRRFLMTVCVFAGLCFCNAMVMADESKMLDASLFPAGSTQVEVFSQNMGPYRNIRIPAICRTTKGTLLAFAEGRQGGDAGNVDLIVRRSMDEGKTWGEIITIWDDGENTCGSPTPVVDAETGTVWLIGHWSIGSDHEGLLMDGKASRPREAYVIRSEDDGLTWSKPLELKHLRKPEWGWYATGPCNGIQLERGPHKGRLIIPANHSVISDEIKGTHRYRAHVIYSDDHGQTWQLGGVHEPLTNESTCVELADGSMMQNMRSYHGKGGRAVAVSVDGGATFGPCAVDETLRSPVCQGSILRYAWPDAETPGVLLFSAPHGNARKDMSVWISEDDGKTWPRREQIYTGPAAYSNLIKMRDGRVGCLFELGEKHPYEKIYFVTVPAAP